MFKQLAEPFHWVTNPIKTGVNKMGIIPRTLIELAENQKWVSPSGQAPKIAEEDESRTIESLKHVGTKFIPIAGQQVYQQGAQGMSGFFGHPIYGRAVEGNSDTVAKERKPRD